MALPPRIGSPSTPELHLWYAAVDGDDGQLQLSVRQYWGPQP
jgi:hypothetical protein